MNWKQLLFPRAVHSAFKRARRAKTALAKPWLTAQLRLGRPAPLARYLGALRHGSQVVRKKQGIVYAVAGDRFVRFAAGPRAMAKLGREYDMWQTLRREGLAAILPHSLALHDVPGGKILESDRLRPIAKEEHAAVALPIVQALLSKARPAVPSGLPATIEAGLAFARQVSGGALPQSFASESDIRDAFARPLMTGISHKDLHYRNVMRDDQGKPVLIDLKSCEPERVVAIDLLALACKNLQAQGKQTLVDAAFAAQQRSWRVNELEPILALVDLPQPLWGQIYLLNVIGLHATKRKGGEGVDPFSRALFLRILAKDWRSPIR